ncbi:leucine-rich repeat-containing protein 74B-like [Halichondria panicea]|uniref:leucine-rich repeat-containing protein 74B-like n=1 Tax=Halichondria panicea TaxID=6063 RepID=UPI00312B34F7
MADEMDVAVDVDTLKDEDTKDTETGPPLSSTGSAGGSEDATGHGSVDGQDQIDDLSDDDLSDTGWDTDLEIEADEKEEYDVTGGKLYLHTCQTLGIIPASYVLRTIQAQETHLNLCHHGVGPKGTKAIAIALTSNTNVTYLDLSDNGLGTEGAIAIATMMKENCYITQLDLSDNNMGAPAAYVIAPLASINSTLVHLSLRGNKFGDKAVEPLAELLRGSYHIKFLDLSHNEFGEEAGIILGPAIADSEVLQTLDLSWNTIRRKGATAIADGLKSNQSLGVVSLAYNGFENQGAAALADALKVNSTLKELDISNNRIGTDGAIVLSRVLPINDTLKEFKIGQNPIRDPGIIAFLDAVKLCTSTTLQTLSFEGLTITLAIEKTLQELSKSHKHLTISHAGTGGYKHPKPKQEPIEKLDNYCKENNVVLIDLFRSFDKEQKKFLSEEAFRNALKHISAPLMEFERQKLIKEFTTTPPDTPPAEGEETTEVKKPSADDEDSPPVFVDYRLLVETAKALKTMKTKQSE